MEIDDEKRKLLSGAIATDTTGVQTLLKVSGFYLDRYNAKLEELDSGALLARRAHQLSIKLQYSHGIEEAKFLQGKAILRRKLHSGAIHSIPEQTVRNKIRLLFELCRFKNLRESQLGQKGDSTTAYISIARKMATRINDLYWIQECDVREAFYCFATGDISKGTLIYDKLMAQPMSPSRRKLLCVAYYYNLPWLTGAEVNQLDSTFHRYCEDDNDEDVYKAVRLIMAASVFLYSAKEEQCDSILREALPLQQRLGLTSIYHIWKEITQRSVFYLEIENIPIDAYLLKSQLHFYRGNYDESLKLCMQSVAEVEKAGETDLLAASFCFLGNTYFALGQNDRSLDFHLKSAASRLKRGLPPFDPTIKKVARMYIDMNKPQEALKFLEKIEFSSLPILAESELVYHESLGSVFAALKKYDRAEQHYLKSLQFHPNTHNAHRLVSMVGVVRFYNDIGQNRKAVPYLNYIFKHQEFLPKTILAEMHLIRFKSDSLDGRLDSAIYHYQKYHAINTEIFSTTKSQQVAEMNARYDSEKKEQELKLKEKNIALLTEQQKVRRTQQHGLIAGTILLAALLFITYNRYRLKNKTNHRLEQQQKLLHAKQDEINQKNYSLQILLNNREMLLKEVHHRVKNNLQVIISLLNAQAAFLKDSHTLSVINDSQNRVYTMALLHQKLYTASDLTSISMKDYLEELTAYLKECLADGRRILLLNFVEPIQLDVSIAVPVGLIINEAVTNAVKYAFRQDDECVIEIALKQKSEHSFQLVIKDNGIGLPPGFDPKESNTLGMTLMYGFAQQLNGDLLITSEKGVRIELTFENMLRRWQELTPLESKAIIS